MPISEPDSDEPQAMGDSDKDVTEEDIEKSDEKKREAIEAFGEGDYAKTVALYTEAILLNPGMIERTIHLTVLLLKCVHVCVFVFTFYLVNESTFRHWQVVWSTGAHTINFCTAWIVKSYKECS
jgi:hypothetical protein